MRSELNYGISHRRIILVALILQEAGFCPGCVSQKTRKLLRPEDFSRLFTGEFLGSQKVFVNTLENTPDSHLNLQVVFSGSHELDSDLFKNLN